MFSARSVRSGGRLFTSNRTLFGRGGSSNGKISGLSQQGGLIEDLVEFRDTRGKRFVAPEQLCLAKDVVRFPRIVGKSLAGGELEVPAEGRVQLVLVSMKGLGQKMCDMYRAPFERVLPGVPVYEVSLVERAMFRVFQKSMERNLLKILPKKRHGMFLCYMGESGMSVKEFARSVQLGNSIVGHAFLVDRSSLIRWRATAEPTDTEIQALIHCTQQLLS